MPNKAAPNVYDLNAILTPSQLTSISNGNAVTVDGVTYQYNSDQQRVVASNE